MKLKKYVLSIVTICSLFLSGCSKFSFPSNANTAFFNFTQCLFRQEVSSNTINLHYSLADPSKYGIIDAPITFGSFDFDSASALASVENWNCALQKFSYQSLSKENQLTYDILSDYFSSLKNEINYRLYEEPLSPLTGIHTQLPILLAEYAFSNETDVKTYLSLLETLPDYFSSLIRFEQEKSSAGLFMSDTSAQEVIAQCEAFSSMGKDHYLLSTFTERLEDLDALSDAKRSGYISKNEEIFQSQVLPAYQNLALAIASLKGTGKTSAGLSSLPEGQEYYKQLIRSQTGSGRSISELKTLIHHQIATDLIDCQTALSENPTVFENISSITDTPEIILQSLEQKISKAFPTAVSAQVSVKYVPTALEEFLSPAFYLIPAIDNFSENTIYINQGHALTDIHLFTTLAHEGYPGHLYQTTYFANTKPNPLRTLLNYNGYVEGWATYAEMCSYYLSPLPKAQATVLQKNNSLILGLYAAADIGIHYDGWKESDTLDFFASYGISDISTVQEIYHYIVSDPGNYLTYYIGYLEILELKKEMIQEKGASFSQKEFHEQLLTIGPAPFEIIRKYMQK